MPVQEPTCIATICRLWRTPCGDTWFSESESSKSSMIYEWEMHRWHATFPKLGESVLDFGAAGCVLRASLSASDWKAYFAHWGSLRSMSIAHQGAVPRPLRSTALHRVTVHMVWSQRPTGSWQDQLVQLDGAGKSDARLSGSTTYPARQTKSGSFDQTPHPVTVTYDNSESPSP